MRANEVKDGRRKMTARGRLGVAAVLLGACLCVALGIKLTWGEDSSLMGIRQRILDARGDAQGRLSARPVEGQKEGAKGLHELKLGGRRDGLVYVPAVYDAARPAPLLVMLHGAGGSARHSLPLLQRLADRTGMILLVPDSRGATWDVIEGGYGPDVTFLDRALAQTFARYNVDPARVAVGGFSDGASYALSLGATNGDLFTHVVAFSPGFAAPAAQTGSPAVFISHGTRDAVLPIEVCSRRIVPRLQRAGYSVVYREFDGPHTVPADIAAEAVDWFLKTKA